MADTSPAVNPITGEPPSLRILALADSDTRLKWAASIARHFESLGGRIELAAVAGASAPTAGQLGDAGLRYPFRTIEVEAIDHSDVVLHYDILVFCMVGSQSFHLFNRVERAIAEGGHTSRPILVTGYAGVVYEKHLEGLLWRAGADVICVNSEADLERFTADFRALGLDPEPLVRTGIGVVDQSATPSRRVEDPPRTLTFAVQPSVPAARDERAWILQELAAYARTHPDRRVIVKLRSRPGERTTHWERYHYAELVEDLELDTPPNLEFSYGLMSDVLASTDVCLTVSSTAAIESMAHGIPTAILLDFGVRESLGNHYFADSGCLRSLRQITADDIPPVPDEWLRRNGVGPDDQPERAVARAMELHDKQAANGQPEPLRGRFYDEINTPYLRAHLEERVQRPRSHSPLDRLRPAAKWVMSGPIYQVLRRVRRWAVA